MTQHGATPQAHRTAVRRAGRHRRRDLGPRDRLRRQPGQDVGRAFDRDARLSTAAAPTNSRASSLDALRIIDRGDMSLGRDDRRLGRRDRPDPVPAVVLHEIRRRLRWPTAAATCVRSVPDVLGLDRQLPQGQRLAARPGLGPGEPNFEVIKEWNKADVYARTIALFGEKLEGGRGCQGGEKRLPTSRATRSADRLQAPAKAGAVAFSLPRHAPARRPAITQ